jgi:hypothetical protein
MGLFSSSVIGLKRSLHCPLSPVELSLYLKRKQAFLSSVENKKRVAELLTSAPDISVGVLSGRHPALFSFSPHII